ncbi:4Fe-4S binding protein [candidate division KSB1 bacterium]|nr:4Fe-4S binding protein [candidate division KSB1 bacterium]
MKVTKFQLSNLFQLHKIRRFSQIVFFLLFLYLIILSVTPQDAILPIDFFIRMDFLAAISTSLAARSLDMIFTTFIPACIIVVMTIVLGRVFCGWICPMGTVLDLWDRVIRGRKKHVRNSRLPHSVSMRNIKYYLLGFFLVAAMFSTQLSWLMDPIPIVTRSVALPIYSYFTYVTTSILAPLWQVPIIHHVSEPLYSFLKAHIFLNNPNIGYQAMSMYHYLIFLVFIGILALSVFQARFWCRYLCPLGALYGLISKLSILRWIVDPELCNACNRCVRQCKTAAIIDKGTGYYVQECVDCFSCQYECPQQAIRFVFQSPLKSIRVEQTVLHEGLALSRRTFLKSAIAAGVVVPMIKLKTSERNPNPWLIRPPGAVAEEEFLDKCIRCGECVEVCLTNALHPALFEADIEGIWTPRLIPMLGYCDYECNACSQVCSTGAIRNISLPDKKQLKIGLAYFNKNKCIPWNENKNCLVCEEHCPVPDKAIKFVDEQVPEQRTNRLVTVKRPYVVTELCIGCGICEYKCPLKDEPGIRVTARNEARHPQRYSGSGENTL